MKARSLTSCQFRRSRPGRTAARWRRPQDKRCEASHPQKARAGARCADMDWISMSQRCYVLTSSTHSCILTVEANLSWHTAERVQRCAGRSLRLSAAAAPSRVARPGSHNSGSACALQPLCACRRAVASRYICALHRLHKSRDTPPAPRSVPACLEHQLELGLRRSGGLFCVRTMLLAARCE